MKIAKNEINTIEDKIDGDRIEISAVICTNKKPNFPLPSKWLVTKSFLEAELVSNYPDTAYYVYARFGWDWGKSISKQLATIKAGEKLVSWIYKNKKMIARAELWSKIH